MSDAMTLDVRMVRLFQDRDLSPQGPVEAVLVGVSLPLDADLAVLATDLPQDIEEAMMKI